MTHQLTATYEGAVVKLTFSEQGLAQLYINDIERETADSGNRNMTLKLGSPVQTGYEQHEFIEALLHYAPDKIHALLSTGGEVLAETEVDRPGS